VAGGVGGLRRGRPGPKSGKDGRLGAGAMRAADERRRRLWQLQREVGRVRQTLAWVRAETARLGAIEAERPLTAGEASEVGRVRRQSEALALEMEALREEFERLTAPDDGARERRVRTP
jgi:hypothetical protein